MIHLSKRLQQRLQWTANFRFRSTEISKPFMMNWSRKKSSLLSSLLQPDQLSIIEEERLVFQELHKTLKAMEAPQDDLDLIADCRSRIDDLFMVVIVGEFNSGKSTFINALIGEKHLKDGVLPTTNKIGILRRSTKRVDDFKGIWRKADNILLDDVEELDLPIDWLNHIAIIDTPGTNAIIARHESLTQKIVPRADLVIFVTSAERPITESESAFLTKISQWGKKVIVIVNKVDILTDPSDKNQVMDFVSQNTSKILGSVKPVPVFGVSGKNALSAKIVAGGIDPALGPGAKQWHESGLERVETYLRNQLGREELIKSKLENPLVVADRVINDAVVQLEARGVVLEGDMRLIEMIEDNMAAFKSDLERDTRYYRQHVQAIIQQLIQRADAFLEAKVTIFNAEMLMDPKKFQEEFNREVLLDITKPVDDVVLEVSELVAMRAKAQAKAVMEYTGSRPRRVAGGMVGSVQDGHLDLIRVDLIDKLRGDVKRILQEHDHKKDVTAMSESVRNSFVQTAAVEAFSMASLGGLVASHMLDVTGVATVSTMALMGLLVVPWKKSSMRSGFESKLKILEQQLDSVVGNNLEKGMQSVSERISSSIGPYTRFVKLEKEKVAELIDRMGSLRQSVRETKAKIK